MQIDAAVLRDATGAYTIERVELAAPAPDEVLVRIVGAGMCHTDVLPRVSPIAAPPIVTGHEGAGVVEAVGAAVTTVAVGDHVVLSFDSCGTCVPCTTGQPAYCDTFFLRNLTGRHLDGSSGITDAQGQPIASRWFGQSSFATHCLATERNVVVVDPSLPLELMGPLGCGIQTGAGSVLEALRVQPGTSLVVFGAGAVGLAAVMAGVVAGATTIIAVDLQPHRRDLALELGATHALDGHDPNVVAAIQGITGGGAHYSFDTTGVPMVMKSALTCLRMTGACVYVGVQQGDLVLDGMALIGKTVTGVLEGSADPKTFIPHMIQLWQDGRFPFNRLIEQYPMSRINEAEQSSLGGGTIKPVLIPGS
ncbi:MAG: NAD(P)-dependent alcohol dehydrogenase [Actinobacteria bacterium]|nr:NAD(P)-dependent alcohol dehydrogenase [Actinomycetota bacterium]